MFCVWELALVWYLKVPTIFSVGVTAQFNIGINTWLRCHPSASEKVMICFNVGINILFFLSQTNQSLYRIRRDHSGAQKFSAAKIQLYLSRMLSSVLWGSAPVKSCRNWYYSGSDGYVPCYAVRARWKRWCSVLRGPRLLVNSHYIRK